MGPGGGAGGLPAQPGRMINFSTRLFAQIPLQEVKLVVNLYQITDRVSPSFENGKGHLPSAGWWLSLGLIGQSLRNVAHGDHFPTAQPPRVKNPAFQGLQGQPWAQPWPGQGYTASSDSAGPISWGPVLKWHGNNNPWPRNLVRVQIQFAYAGISNGGKAWYGISSEMCHFLFCLQQRKGSWREKQEKVSSLFKANFLGTTKEFCWKEQLKM